MPFSKFDPHAPAEARRRGVPASTEGAGRRAWVLKVAWWISTGFVAVGYAFIAWWVFGP